jgi:galactokinase
MTFDHDRFAATLRAHAPFLDPDRPVATARAPGRLDLMGGIADYSGSLVLEWPLATEAHAAAQRFDAAEVSVRTTDAAAARGRPEVVMPLAEVLGDYAAVRASFAADPATHWAAYVAGAMTVLHREHAVAFDGGVRWLIASDVPAGKGVGSSAAI